MLVYVLALVAAVVVAAGEVIQQRTASQAPPQDNLSVRLLLWLVRRPWWLAGLVCSLVGNSLFATAEGRGSVALVEALFVTRLVFALLMAAGWRRRRLPLRDVLGALAVVGGLAAFVVAAQPRKGGPDVPDLHWLIGGSSTVALALILTAAATRGAAGRPARRAALLGAGAGCLYGLQAGLMQSAVHQLSTRGVLATLAGWHPYTVVAVALMGMLLLQSAFGTAPLPASYPAVVTTELLAGIAVGVWLLSGAIRLTVTTVAVSVVGLVVMVAGIYLLTTSPLVTGQLDELIRAQDVGMAEQVEMRLERELRQADRRAHRAATRRERGPLAPLQRRRARRDLVKIEAGIDRLCRLQDDIREHRRAEQQRVAALPAPRASEQHDQDRALDEQERRIDTHAEGLRRRAQALARKYEDGRSTAPVDGRVSTRERGMG